MSWVAVAVAGGTAIAGYMSSMSAADRADAIRNKELQNLLASKIPDPAQQKLALQRFALTGELTPQFQQAIKAAPSEFNKVAVDQKQKSAQNRALSELSDIGNKGGLRLQDKAALQDAQMAAQVQDRGARNAILADSQARGQGGGSGMALQAQLQGQQATGDRAARSALSVAGSAQDRALQAIMGAGDLATKGRGQDFAEQSARAQANDAINRFNTQNLQNVNAANTGIFNDAAQRNLAARQQVADQNVGLANKEQQYNKELYQQQFQNQLNLANSQNGVYNQQAGGELARGEQQGNFISNLGGAAVGGVTAYNQSKKPAAPGASPASSEYSEYDDELEQKKRRAQDQGSTYV